MKLSSLLYTILPGTCCLCNAPSHRQFDLCIACEQDLPWLHQACARCKLPLPSLSQPASSLCGSCLTKPPPWDTLYSAFIYQFPVNNLILQFKENQNLVYGKLLANLLVKFINGSDQRAGMNIDLLLPVPLHRSTLRKRKFNQSMEIARQLSRAWQIPIDNTNCHRVRHTKAQKLLNIRQRAKNIKGVFKLTHSYHGEHIGIVDDVVTTTATITELSNLLLKNGAGSVQVFCLARTGK